ncbi:MAG: putative Ig domain-containing protein [Myxococcales bacterium]|nr:putative Ig domain-containing protein [Myxococcales bacterium]
MRAACALALCGCVDANQPTLGADGVAVACDRDWDCAELGSGYRCVPDADPALRGECRPSEGSGSAGAPAGRSDGSAGSAGVDGATAVVPGPGSDPTTDLACNDIPEPCAFVHEGFIYPPPPAPTRRFPEDDVPCTQEPCLTEIAAGGRHTCALAADYVLCWGDNSYGQLGDGTTLNHEVAANVPGAHDSMTHVAAGSRHSCSWHAPSGNLRCWGDNRAGQLGVDAVDQASSPVDVEGLQGAGIDAISAGESHTCVVAYGFSDVSSVVYCFGDNSYGQLGHSGPVSRGTVVRVSDTENAVAVAAGRDHTCALTPSRVVCWGRNDHGQLGDGTTVDSAQPVTVVGLPSRLSGWISAGDAFTCALADAGAYCWGRGPLPVEGQWPYEVLDTAPPTLVSLGSGFDISVGAEHTCAVVAGDVMCWGFGGHREQFGQLPVAPRVGLPLPVLDPSDGFYAKRVSAGLMHTCAIAGGDAICWGQNSAGQLGRSSQSFDPTTEMLPQRWTRPNLDACGSDPRLRCGDGATGCTALGSSSFTCTCGSGYSGTNTYECQDVDECLGGAENACGTGAIGCTNTAGSYTCSCDSGYVGSGSKACEDVNECAAGVTSACGPGGTECINTTGSYECQCLSGYRGQGSTACVEIDECENGAVSACGSGATGCTNTAGSYQCACGDGYTGSGSTACQDVNECSGGAVSACGSGAIGCANTAGSYACTCDSGYAGTGTTACSEIDECAAGAVTACGSGAIGCTNTAGGYQCDCSSGYAGTGTTACSEIDECAAGAVTACGSGAIGCSNTAGSYACTCDSGYAGTGTTACTLLPPSNLSYATNPVSYTVGIAIADNLPSSDGGPATSYAVDPALPDGLSLDTGTGVISGTPTTAAATADHVITATNAAGSTNVTLSLEVVPGI